MRAILPRRLFIPAQAQPRLVHQRRGLERAVGILARHSAASEPAQFLAPALGADENAKRRFLQEARAESALDHSNIGTVYEIGETDEGQLFIAMACYEGETLEAKIDRGLLSPHTALAYAAQLACGLAHAHAHGVVHRDVKPGNVMITPDGTVKLLDFGLAKLAGEATQTTLGQVRGTACYMSPEQARGERVDARTDVWSLGVVVYEMLTGRRPFAGESTDAVIHAILHEEPVPAEKQAAGVELALARVIDRCLAKDPAQRYPSAVEVLAELRAWQGQLLGSARGREAHRAAGRKRAPAVTVGGVALLAIAAIAVSLIRDTDSADSQRIDSVAVLPFANLSPDPGQEYFVDGMHEGVITDLAKIASLKVISRTSTLRYRNTDEPLPEIGRTLGVAAIIRGSAQLAGGRVRITAQLIAAAADRHLWAETYDRELTAANVFAIQSEIAAAVAREVRAVLAPEEKQRLEKLPTQNLAALEAYFRGKASASLQASSDYQDAIGHLRRAIELDPRFGHAHALLGEVYVLQIYFGGLPVEEQVAKAEPHIRRALELDEQLSEAHVALGWLERYSDDMDAAEAAFRRGIEFGPNSANAYFQYGNFKLWQLRDPAAAVELTTRGLELDPRSTGWQQQLSFALMGVGDFEKAREVSEERIARNPDESAHYKALGLLLTWAYCRHDEAIKAFRRAAALDPGLPHHAADLALSYRNLGDRDAALLWSERGLALAPEGAIAPIFRGWIHELRGEEDRALAAFRQASKTADFYCFAVRALAEADWKAGRPAAAVARFAVAYPSLARPDAEIRDIKPAIDFACYLLASGERERADRLIEQIHAIMPSVPRMGLFGYWLFDAVLYAAQGDRDRALAALRAFVAEDGCTSWFVEDPLVVRFLEPLHDDSEFQELVATMDARLAAQRARLKQMEANGELAPIPPLPAK